MTTRKRTDPGPWLLLVLVACGSGERQAAQENGHAAAVARELDAMRELELSMCGCRSLDCLASSKSAIQRWWDGLSGRIGPPTLDAIELSHAEAIGRSADVCFHRTITQTFLATAERYRQAVCGKTEELDRVLEGMQEFADGLGRLLGDERPRLVGDEERERGFASLTHFGWCAKTVDPGVESRVPPVFRPWVSKPEPKPGPNVIY
jgi:hypothetical protein